MTEDRTLPDDWWTVRDVAAYLGIAESTVRAYLVRGQMPPTDRRLGKSHLWQPTTIRAWAPTRRRATKKAGDDA